MTRCNHTCCRGKSPPPYQESREPHPIFAALADWKGLAGIGLAIVGAVMAALVML